MGTVWTAEVIPRGSWKGERWEVGSSTPAGKRRLARDGANLTSSAHLVRVSEINDLDVLVREPVLHVGPSRPSVGRRGEVVLCALCASRAAQMLMPMLALCGRGVESKTGADHSYRPTALAFSAKIGRRRLATRRRRGISLNNPVAP